MTCLNFQYRSKCLSHITYILVVEHTLWEKVHTITDADTSNFSTKSFVDGDTIKCSHAPVRQMINEKGEDLKRGKGKNAVNSLK